MICVICGNLIHISALNPIQSAQENNGWEYEQERRRWFDTERGGVAKLGQNNPVRETAGEFAIRSIEA